MRRETNGLEKITMNLFRGDMDRLQVIAGKTGASKIIRTLVRAWLDRKDAEFVARAGTPQVEVEL